VSAPVSGTDRPISDSPHRRSRFQGVVR